MPADRRLTIRQPEDGRHLLSVVGGTGTGLHAGGAQVAIEAEVVRDSHGFYRWAGEGGVVFADAHAPRTTVVVPHGPARVFARYLPGPPLADADISVPRRWIEVLLQAIRNDTARPTVHARNLFHVAAAMYDAWAAYSRTARPWLFGEAREPCARPAPPAAGDIRRAREEAISHAAWRLVRHRFRHSPGVTRTARNADMLMAALGYAGASATSPAAELGRCLAELYITRGLEDGSNEENGYASLSYAHVNTEMPPSVPGNPELTDPDRWQPLDLQLYVDQSGHVLDGVAEFITPEWGRVTPFALSEEDLTVYRRDGGDYHVYHDPGPPPTLRGPLSEHYKWGFALVAMWSSHLSPEDGVRIDIAPSGQGNLAALPRRIDEYPDFYDPVPQGPGHRINPATGRPYTPQWVPRGDYTRVLAEYWADGPDSETPPGHWFTILNAVNDHERLARRLGGRGPRLDPLEWDVKAYFALGGAMHDAAVAAWGIKGWYDYVRPISALRTMADRGQSGDPDGPAWSPEGMPLAERLIEPIGPDDRLAGENGEHVGKVKVLAWRGPGHIDSPVTDTAGVGWIRAENWWPYQRPTFVTPPFAGYVSGHSTFSRRRGRGADGAHRRSVLSGRHERVSDSRQYVPGLRARALRRHGPAMGHLPRCGRPVQPVAHLGRHSPARRRHTGAPDRGKDRTRRLSPRHVPFRGRPERIDPIAPIRAGTRSVGSNRSKGADRCMSGAARRRRVLPIGVCPGLQGVVEYYGGRLSVLPTPIHGKPSMVNVRGGRIFEGPPARFEGLATSSRPRCSPRRIFEGPPARFEGGRYHSLYADRRTFPDALAITAQSDEGIVMAIEPPTLPCSPPRCPRPPGRQQDSSPPDSE